MKATKKKKATPRKKKEIHASQDEKERRITEVLQMRLAGAQFHDIAEHAKENWKNVQSRAQIYTYIQWSDEYLAKAREKDRQKRITLSLARRETIYANCVRGGDYAAALSTLKDLSALEGHYPEKGQQQSNAGGNTYINISIEERKRRISSIAEELGIEGLLEADAGEEAAGGFEVSGEHASNGNGKHNGNGAHGKAAGLPEGGE